METKMFWFWWLIIKEISYFKDIRGLDLRCQICPIIIDERLVLFLERIPYFFFSFLLKMVLLLEKGTAREPHHHHHTCWSLTVTWEYKAQ